VARWDGSTWRALGAGTNGYVSSLVRLANGDLVAGGAFLSAGGVVSAHVARLTTTCPATAASFGAGCTGSAGPNVLTATSLPWIGSTFRSAATGMPAISLALVVRGFSTLATPLSAILPQGGAGCTLLVSPDLLELALPAAGSLQMQIAIPNSVALVAQTFHEQVVPVEFDAVGNIVALTSTNALQLTIGAL